MYQVFPIFCHPRDYYTPESTLHEREWGASQVYNAVNVGTPVYILE